MLVTLENVSKSFAGKQVLRGVSLQLNPREKVGLVGANGVGKTTLLRLIHGNLEPDGGRVFSLPRLKIGLLRQRVQPPPQRSVFEEATSVFDEIHRLARVREGLAAQIGSSPQGPPDKSVDSLLMQYGDLQSRWEFLGGYSYEARTEQVLFGLGFQRSDMQRQVRELSGGEMNRLNLGKLLLSEPDLLLLDEPTNHLDWAAINWLGNFLRDSRQAYWVASHDRYFLDSTVNKIVEISEGRLEVYSGNYTAFFKAREVHRQAREKAYRQQSEFIRKTEDFIQRNLAGQKTKQAQSRRNMLNRMERLERQGPSGPPARFRFDLHRPSGEQVLKVSQLTVGYSGAAVVTGIDFTLYRGQRLGIVGPNGSGKTTLLRTVLGEMEPLKGEVLVGRDVRFAYYHQHLSELNSRFNLLEEVRLAAPSASETYLRNHLAAFLFQGEAVFCRVGSLSGGEKSRLSLAKIVLLQANTLILDEPSNHLDIPSREALEQALLSYPGTILMVSHDRYLVNKVAERMLILGGEGRSSLFEGSYAEWESCQGRTKTGNTRFPLRPQRAAHPRAGRPKEAEQK